MDAEREQRPSTRRARQLRRDMTPAEVVLWDRLRDRQLGRFKFRRQQPFGPFYADFYCAEAKLAVELDGDTHVGREAADAARTVFFEAEGVAVVRFWNPDVYDKLDGVLTAILDACTARGPDPVPGSSPSPLGGEGRGEARGVRGRTTHDGHQKPPPHPG